MITQRVAILLFDNVEVLDFAGPYEVFTTATRVAQQPVFEVMTVAAEPDAVRARAGLVVRADYALHAHPPVDLLIVPGGVVTAALASPALIDWIAEVASQSRLTASVCTGAFLLAKAGVIDTQTVTTHWEDIDDLRAGWPSLRVVDGVRWVDQGRIVTSAGISAGIDMSLHLIERCAGRELALRTARQMDFDWTGNPEAAP